MRLDVGGLAREQISCQDGHFWKSPGFMEQHTKRPPENAKDPHCNYPKL